MSYISAFKDMLAKCKEVAQLQEKSTVRVLIRYVYSKLGLVDKIHDES